MPLEPLPPNEQWDDLLQSLDFVERRFAEWLDPKLLARIRDEYEARRQKWATARSNEQKVPRNSGLPMGHVGESPASRSLRYWSHVRHELRALADDGRMSLAKSHELLAEVRERQSALERKLAPEELPEVVPIDEEAPAPEVVTPIPRRSMLEIVLDPRNIQMLLALGGAVPNRIAVAFVAELRVYGFWSLQGRFAELLRILERKSGNGLASVAKLARRNWLYERMTGRAVAELARRIWLRGDDGPRWLPNSRGEFGYAA